MVERPSHGRSTDWPASSFGTISRTVSDGIAKPMPTFPPPAPAVAICEFTPITRPLASSSGPPELPGLIGASVWITLSMRKPLGASISRSRPETIPAVAVRSRPSGKPMAIAASPTSTESDSASASGVTPSAALASTSSTARSDDGSVPTTRALTGLASSSKRTLTWLALPTTWALVTIVPSRSMRKPVPDPPPACTETTASPARA